MSFWKLTADTCSGENFVGSLAGLAVTSLIAPVVSVERPGVAVGATIAPGFDVDVEHADRRKITRNMRVLRIVFIIFYPFKIRRSLLFPNG